MRLKKIIKNKKIKSIVLFILLILVYVAFIMFNPPSISGHSVKEEYILGAHRGNSKEHMENTLPALESAVENPKYEFIEFDVQYTKDKEIILSHDTHLLRTDHNPVWIGDLTYNELQNETEYNMTTYDQAIEVTEDKPLIIEIKSQGNLSEDKKLVNYIMEDIKNREKTDEIMIASVSKEVINYTKKEYPKIPVGRAYWTVLAGLVPIKEATNKIYSNRNADYLLIHSSNYRFKENLIENKPDDINLAFWYFNDEYYLRGERWW